MPSPSPTTTSAVKLNRRPPLTTLATRLMATTRSTYAVFSAGPPSRPPRPPRRPPESPPVAPRRWGPGISRSSSRCVRGCACGRGSQDQPRLAGAVGDGRDPAGVAVATPVEHDRLDAGVLGALGHQLADLLGLGGLVALEAAQVGLHRGRRGQRVAGHVVDDLDEDVPRGAGHDEAGPRRRTAELLAHAQVAPAAGGALRPRAAAYLDADCHDYLPAFPALRRICSPW